MGAYYLTALAVATAPVAGAYFGLAARNSGLGWPRYALAGGFLWACLFLPGIDFGMRLRGAATPLYRLATVYALLYLLWLIAGIGGGYFLIEDFTRPSDAPDWIGPSLYGLLAVNAATWLGSLVWLLGRNNWLRDPAAWSADAMPRPTQLQPYVLATLWILLTAIGEMIR